MAFNCNDPIYETSFARKAVMASALASISFTSSIELQMVAHRVKDLREAYANEIDGFALVCYVSAISTAIIRLVRHERLDANVC